MGKPKDKTHHCTGCRNIRGRIADRVDTHCCTCCVAEDDSRPGRGTPAVTEGGRDE